MTCGAVTVFVVIGQCDTVSYYTLLLYTILLRGPWCAYRLLFVGYEGVDPQLDINIIGTSGTEIVLTRRCLLRFGFSETAETKHSDPNFSFRYIFGRHAATVSLVPRLKDVSVGQDWSSQAEAFRGFRSECHRLRAIRF
jgi:hypothetical protein